jgi:enoyl-CoA hydratase
MFGCVVTFRFLTVIEDRGWIRINIHRAERLNAIGVNLARELALCARQTRRAVLAAGAGILGLEITAEPVARSKGKVWIAGGDLGELSKICADEARDYCQNVNQFVGLMDLPVLVLVLIDGYAVGGGAELALMGDIRLATAESSLQFKHLEIGLPLGYGTTSRLVRLIGLSQAQKIIYRGERMSAKACCDIGLLHETFGSVKALKDESRAIREAMGCDDLCAFQVQKLMLQRATDLGDTDAFEKECNLFTSQWKNPKHQRFLDEFLKEEK